MHLAWASAPPAWSSSNFVYSPSQLLKLLLILPIKPFTSTSLFLNVSPTSTRLTLRALVPASSSVSSLTTPTLCLCPLTIPSPRAGCTLTTDTPCVWVASSIMPLASTSIDTLSIHGPRTPTSLSPPSSTTCVL